MAFTVKVRVPMPKAAKVRIALPRRLGPGKAPTKGIRRLKGGKY